MTVNKNEVQILHDKRLAPIIYERKARKPTVFSGGMNGVI